MKFRTDTVCRTRKELDIVRGYLRARLHEYKKILVGKGRGGQWLTFLRENNIPRSTANRYVKDWERKLAPTATNCPTEAIPAPTHEQILQLVKTVMAKLARVLTTQDSVVQFMTLLAEALGEQESTSTLDVCIRNEPLPTLPEATCAS